MESLFSYARNLSPIGVRATAAPAAADDDPLKEVSYLRGSVAALTETVAEMRDELSQLRDDGEAARNEISQLRELVRRGPDGALVLAEGEADDDSFRPYSPFQVRPPRVDTAAAAPSPGQIRRSRGIEISTPTTEEKPRARARTASGDAKPVMSPLAMSSSSAPPPPPPPPPRRSGARLLVAGACLLVLAYAAGAYTPPLWLAPAPPPPPLEAAPVAVPWAVRLDRLGRGARAAVADAGVRLGGGARRGQAAAAVGARIGQAAAAAAAARARRVNLPGKAVAAWRAAKVRVARAARATAAVVEATAELATAALAAADPRLVENAGAAAAGDRCDCVGHSITVLNEVADGLRSRSAAPSSTSA